LRHTRQLKKIKETERRFKMTGTECKLGPWFRVKGLKTLDEVAEYIEQLEKQVNNDELARLNKARRLYYGITDQTWPSIDEAIDWIKEQL
jgi:hypothetical protein